MIIEVLLMSNLTRHISIGWCLCFIEQTQCADKWAKAMYI